MNCANHPEQSAVAYCRSCGKALCAGCQRTAQGTVFCEEHAPIPVSAPEPPPAQAAYSPYTAPPSALPPQPGYVNLNVSPGLAFLLGMIPGVGAIYNGQYAKGLIHVIVFGVLISIQSSGGAAGFEPLFGILTFAWWCYMAFEAYHTARRRQLGQPVDEFSSIIPLRGSGRFPVGPIVLIALGILFLLMNFDLVRMRDIVRYWPVFLIVMGVYLLYGRLAGAPGPAIGTEVTHDQR